MNKKKLILIISIIIIGISLIVIGILIFDNKKVDKKKAEKQQEYKYKTLAELSDKIYKDKAYLELPKNEKGIYYMTIKEYKRRKYKEELIEKDCDENFELVYFYPENKDGSEPETPFSIKTSCKDISDEMDLLTLARQIYNNKTYLEFPKYPNGNYYLTIGEYKKRGYNLNNIDINCPDEFEVMVIDLANKDEYDLSSMPVYVFSSCQQ